MKRALVSLLVLTAVGATGTNATASVEKAHARNHGVAGEITDLAGATVTLTSGGQKNKKQTVLTVNEKTKVFIETGEMVPAGKEGAPKRKVVEGALADLKIGQKVSATVSSNVAIRITVKYIAPPKPAPDKQPAPE